MPSIIKSRGPLFTCSPLVCRSCNSIKEWCDLENRVRDHSRFKEMAPFDRSHTSSYLPSIVTMALSCILCEIWWLTGRKLRHFYTPPVFSAPAGCDSVGILWKCLMLIKLESLDYCMVNKLWQDVKPFSSNTGTSRTDRQTDGWTELLYRYSTSVCWRDKKSCLITAHVCYSWRDRQTDRWKCNVKSRAMWRLLKIQRRMCNSV